MVCFGRYHYRGIILDTVFGSAGAELYVTYFALRLSVPTSLEWMSATMISVDERNTALNALKLKSGLPIRPVSPPSSARPLEFAELAVRIGATCEQEAWRHR